MKLLFFFATVLLFLTVGSSQEYPSSSYSIDRFLADHGKTYYGDEYNHRQQIFLRNLGTILTHNLERSESNSKSKSKSNYTMGVNRFADMLPNELPLGYDKSLHSAWKKTKSSSSAVERKLGVVEDTEMDPKHNNRVSFFENIDCACFVWDLLFVDAYNAVSLSTF
jgi:hypothetical protein